ncbi:amidohydrolase [Paenibacillus sp. FSL H8-0548]|uniref:M20 metallopeptidase family protein n=1 Tax=Paenibacillus sp. FSL H8-0548 TaxID=1920422 RepID=UPI00096C77A4|nr:amidohydrolase [Paenibacillus sp. FSL H8-0548]OMF19757.1 amidohydrolase [Paenibacillus sp. FSL H8-0548]
MNTNPIFTLLEEREQEWTTLRREFHRLPELMYDVDRTSERIAELLDSYGLEVQRNVGNHFGKGVIGLLRGSKPGKTILLRADMDALPIQERNDVDYRSSIDGAMHACGHDAHVTMLLAAAYGLSQHREALAGEVRFVFQPAEEGAAESPLDGRLLSGGRDMVESGAADGVSASFAFHVWPGLPVGHAAVHRKYAMAASSHFQVSFRGRSGHHGAQHLAADALLMTAHFVTETRAAVASAVNPFEPTAFAFGKMEAGTVINAIAETGQIEGTYRAFEPSTVERIRHIIEQCANACAERFGGEAEIRFRMGKALINDEAAVTLVVAAAEKVFGSARASVLDQPSLAGEDFSYYLDHSPGAMVLIGVGNEERGIIHPLHHPQFDLDEHVLVLGAKLHVQLVLDTLAGGLE